MPGDYGLFSVIMFRNRCWPVRAPADDGWVTGTDELRSPVKQMSMMLGG